jgi:hypothetical protein
MQERLNESLYRIANEPVLSYPFQHFFVEDVLPEDVYDRIHANWPAPESFLNYEEAKNPEQERFYFPLEPERLAKLPAEPRAFWNGIRAWLMSPDLRRIALGKYQPQVDVLLSNVFGVPIGDDVIGSYTKYALSLVWDISGYALLPHADDPRVIFNFLFYLPAPGEESAFGTSIYLPKDRNFLSSGEARHQRHEFEHVSTYPFKRNAMFSFMRTARSFHGVEPVTGEDSVRRLILFSIRIDEEMMPDRADEVAELVPA